MFKQSSKENFWLRYSEAYQASGLTQKQGLAHKAVKKIAELYEVEEEIK